MIPERSAAVPFEAWVPEYEGKRLFALNRFECVWFGGLVPWPRGRERRQLDHSWGTRRQAEGTAVVGRFERHSGDSPALPISTSWAPFGPQRHLSPC